MQIKGRDLTLRMMLKDLNKRKSDKINEYIDSYIVKEAEEK